MSDQALEALSESLGSRKPEPELDLSSITEVDEVLALEFIHKACQSAGSETKCSMRVQNSHTTFLYRSLKTSSSSFCLTFRVWLTQIFIPG